MDVLAEGGDSGELTDEVEVGSHKGMNSTPVINRESLVSGQSQVLYNKILNKHGYQLKGQ